MSSTDSSNNNDEDDINRSEAERNLYASNPPPLYKFVFTGGPCGGKTTALARVFSYLRERSFEVITVPECFSILSNNGMSGEFFSTPGMAKIIQGTVLDLQMAMEDGVERVLRARGKPAVIICDRGTMDGSAYLAREEFEQILQERNTDVVQIRDNRYDGIFHLVTAADGAESYYTLENNKVRTESPEEARAMDRKTQDSWVGHPHLYVFDNSTLFEEKMARLVDVLSKIVGLPSNLTRRSAKFLLKGEPDISKFPTDMAFQMFEVEKVYLQQIGKDQNPENYSFIRRRTNIDYETGRLLGSTYQLTLVHFSTNPDDRKKTSIEQKRIISRREYESAYLTRDHRRHIVRQKRVSFLYNKQSFVVHMYVQPAPGLCILHAQVEASAQESMTDLDAVLGKNTIKVDLPPFLEVERRLKHTPEDEATYGAYNLSLLRPHSRDSILL